MKKVILTICVIIGMTYTTTAQGHYIGEMWGGGVVFDVSSDGQHGLIAETQDQGNCTFVQAQQLVNLSQNHSESGKAYSDWRLPDRNELKKMYHQKDAIGGFSQYTTYYWSSEELDEYTAWAYMFDNGGNWYNFNNNTDSYLVRAIRSF